MLTNSVIILLYTIVVIAVCMVSELQSGATQRF